MEYCIKKLIIVYQYLIFMCNAQLISSFVCVCLTPQAGQNTDVGLVQQRQCVMADVKMREVRDKIVSHEEAH